jgi:hypothetical protein
MAGRPRKRLDARLLRKVESWILKDEKPLSFVLGQLGFTVKQWESIVKADERLRDILDMQRLKEEEAIIDTLKTTNQHKATAAIFLAKARHGWQDNQKPEPTETKVNVQVMLPPAAKSDAEFAKLVNPAKVIDHKPGEDLI